MFTRLFRNPDWYNQADVADVKKRLEIFRKYMENEALTSNERRQFFKAAKENPTFKSNYRFYLWIFLKDYISTHKRTVWGWKEPNTHIFIDEINTAFPQFRYVHVLRHGLDMAFSHNTQQLSIWGHKYDILLHGAESKYELAVKQLDYWIQSTKDLLKKGEMFGDRIHLLNYTKLYSKPTQEIDKLLEFLDIDVHQSIREELYRIPKEPPSANRFRKHDLSIFRNDQIEFVEQMGFESTTP
jgi:hypothetical protein